MGVPLNLPFDEKHVQFDYDGETDEKPKFIGYTADPNASDSASVWMIKKLSYDGSRQCTRIQMFGKMTWDARTNL